MNKCIMIEDIKNALIELARSDKWLGRETTTNIIEALLSLPTIDIVHCVECRYSGDDWWCYKHEFTPIPIEDYFCKDGERKDYE